MTRRVLVVDDNEIVGWTLRARLWIAGCEVILAGSAAEALATLEIERFDLVLMDLSMPDMTGLEAMEIIEQRGLCPGTPVVLLTASEDIQNVQAARALGASGYLTKAAAQRALAPAIDRLLAEPGISWIDDHHCIAPAAARAARPGVAQ